MVHLRLRLHAAPAVEAAARLQLEQRRAHGREAGPPAPEEEVLEARLRQLVEPRDHRHPVPVHERSDDARELDEEERHVRLQEDPVVEVGALEVASLDAVVPSDHVEEVVDRAAEALQLGQRHLDELPLDLAHELAEGSGSLRA